MPASSPQNSLIATVFGGSGFIGRYVVKRLAHAGYIVRVAVRHTEQAAFLKTMGGVGQIVPLSVSIEDDAAIARAVAGASVVVNLVGILAEHRAGDFKRLQAEGAGKVASAAAAAGATQFVQLSAIGADPKSPSLYAASKAAGEAAVRTAMPNAIILRPSVVFGPEDQFLNRFAAMASISPIVPVISGSTRFQPVYVGDVADAVMAALASPEAAGKTYELGGPKILTMRALLEWILTETQRPRCLLAIPSCVAALQASVLERLPGKLLTRDQLLLLARDNVTTGLPGLDALGITPTPLEQVAPLYLKRYRPGGGKRAMLNGI